MESTTPATNVRVVHAATLEECTAIRRQLQTASDSVLLVQDWIVGKDHYPVLMIAGGWYVGSAHNEEQGQEWFRTHETPAGVTPKRKGKAK